MKRSGLILWNAIAICEMFKICWQLGKHLVKDYSENLLKDRSFRSEQWSNVIRFLRKTSPCSLIWSEIWSHLVSKSWQVQRTLSCITSSSWLKVVIDHVSKLSPSQESITFLSSLLFNTDSPFDQGIEDDRSQRRRNPRIKHRKIRKSLSFIWLRRQRIVYRFWRLSFIDPRFVSCGNRVLIWVWEFPEMQVPDSIPRSFHRTN